MYHSADFNGLHRLGAVRLPVTFKLPETSCSLHVPWPRGWHSAC